MKKTPWIWALPLLLVACGEEAEASGGPPAPTPEVRPPRPEVEPGPLVEDPSFELRATASGPYAVGDRGTFDILLTPRGDYHVNEEYPMTVTLAGPEAVTWPRSELGNEDARERTRARARFDVPFTASSAGEHRVTADVDFAVCTPETCMPEQRTLAVLLPVE